MSVSKSLRITLTLAIALILNAGLVAAQAPEVSESGPLAPFARLVGGEWHLGDQYQIFEWGMEEKSVHVRGYRIQDGAPVLVSDGMIYFHPGESTLRGVFVAEGMGIDVFDYRMDFEGDRMTAALSTYGQLTGEFEEVWEFTDDDHYEWSLFEKDDDGPKKMMGGTFTRK